LATVKGRGRGGKSGVEWRGEKGRVSPEAEFFDVIGTKVFRVFLLAIFTVTSTNGFYSPTPPPL
jgi:hypothetical protein